ncbi:MAG: LamG domain-containing protein [Planctomycetota bacterium]
MAYLIVLFALAIGVVLSASFLRSSSTTISVASNVQSHPTARGVAETGIELAMRHIKTESNWRSGKVSGAWERSVDWQDGSFTVRFTDEDGDLADDVNDPVTVTSVGRVNGVSHTVEAVIEPYPAASLNVLYALRSANAPAYNDTRRVSLMEAWGFTVTLIDEHASTNDYTAALASSDVVYVSSTVSSSAVQPKLGNPPVGIVTEEPNLQDTLGLTSGDASLYMATQVYIADNLHPITSGLPLGYLQVTESGASFWQNTTAPADDARVLATRDTAGVTTSAGGVPTVTSNATLMLTALDAGDAMFSGDTAHGRRVGLPHGYIGFDAENLTADGADLIRRCLEWAAGGGTPRGHVAAWAFDETTGTAAYDGIDDHHGVLVNGPTNNTAGRLGQAIDFDGADDHVAVQHRPQLSPSGGLSVTMWVNADAWTDGEYLLSKSAVDEYRLWVTGGNLQFDIAGVGTVATTAPSASVWHHVAAAYDGSELRLYLDGVLAASTSTSGSITATSEPLYLGGDGPNGSPASHFDGTLDDVRVFNRGVSYREVEWLHETASIAGLPRLVSAYRFETPPADSTPQLVSHWALDDAGTGDGYEGATGVAHIGLLSMANSAYIDAYNEKDGAYDIANARPVYVVTNLTGNSPNAVQLSSQTYIYGDLLLGPDADASKDVSLSNDAEITGEVKVAETPFTLPARRLPGDFTASSDGDQTYDGGTRTWTGDLKLGAVTFNNNAVVNVSGDTRVQVTGTFTMNNGTINVPDGANLEIYIDQNVNLNNNSVINSDTTGPDRVQIVFIGSNVNDDLTMKAQSSISGQIVGPDDLHMYDTAQVYGSVITRDDIYMRAQNGIHYATGLGDVITGAGGTTGSDGSASGTVDAMGLSFGNPNNAEAGMTGQSGDAFDFNGGDAFIDVDHHPAYLLDRGAVALWFSPDNTSGTQTLISKAATGFDTGGHLRLYLSGGTLVGELATVDTTYTLQSTSGVAAEAWQHAALSFGPGGLRLYLDGVLVDSDAYAGGLGPSSGGRGNELPWIIGASGAGTAAATLQAGSLTAADVTDFYEGMLDDIRIYNRPLSAPQVALVMTDSALTASPENDRVVDIANADRPAHLPIASTASITWLDGDRLRADSASTIATPSAAPKVNSRLAAADAFTLYAVFAPANVTQDGPANVVSYSDSTSSRNLTLGQDDATLDARLRAGSATNNGTPALTTGDVLTQHGHERVMLVYDGSTLSLYRNGELETSLDNAGSLNGLAANSPFMLFNEVGGTKPWQGVLEAVELYDAALDATQRDRVFRDQAPGEPGVSTGEGSVRVMWIETP